MVNSLGLVGHWSPWQPQFCHWREKAGVGIDDVKGAVCKLASCPVLARLESTFRELAKQKHLPLNCL